MPKRPRARSGTAWKTAAAPVEPPALAVPAAGTGAGADPAVKRKAEQWLGKVIAEFFVVEAVVGEGQFGVVLCTRDIRRNLTCAVKVEHHSAVRVLATESKVLSKLDGEPGFPKWIWYTEADPAHPRYSFLFMSLIQGARTLEALRHDSPGKRMDVSTAAHHAYYALCRLKALHTRGYAYRDVKPDNFVVSPDGMLYLLDFGLAKNLYGEDGTHVALECNRSIFLGTPRFASLRSHQGVRQSRRDDIESLGYMLVYLVNGHLPWQSQFLPGGVLGPSHVLTTPPDAVPLHWEHYPACLRVKESVSLDTLTKGLPAAFRETIAYGRDGLHDAELPDYDTLLDMWSKTYFALLAGTEPPGLGYLTPGAATSPLDLAPEPLATLSAPGHSTSSSCPSGVSCVSAYTPVQPTILSTDRTYK